MRRTQIITAIESETVRNELKRLTDQIGHVTRHVTDMIAEVISLPQFTI